jgi:MMPL family
MDYHVFVLSRVRELVDRGRSTEQAVAEGIKSTAGVITSAAAVMVVTFAAFATGSDQGMKQLGVGLAAAILIDATIVRAVLLPATMKLLGSRNWYLPKRLAWLPKFEPPPDRRWDGGKDRGARHPAGAAASGSILQEVQTCHPQGTPVTSASPRPRRGITVNAWPSTRPAS